MAAYKNHSRSAVSGDYLRKLSGNVNLLSGLSVASEFKEKHVLKMVPFHTKTLLFLSIIIRTTLNETPECETLLFFPHIYVSYSKYYFGKNKFEI